MRPNVEDALARTLLAITFDGAEQPQVAVPLGDFFGSGPGINDFESSINKVQSDGSMVANWYMPYRKSAQIRLTNSSKQPITVSAVTGIESARPPEGSLYFHARWRYQDELQTRKADGTLDWPALRVSGTPGRFVGLLLNVFNPTPAWWGEGDEKIYVDGESFPSTFGTGTEDYFGYAWCDNHPYMNPFHAQTRCDGPGTKGNSSNMRYQILDSCRSRNRSASTSRSGTGRPSRSSTPRSPTSTRGPARRSSPASPTCRPARSYPRPAIKREPGVIEAENLKVMAKTAGEVPNQDMLPFGDAWSAGNQLWWVVHEPNARLDLELPVKKAGTYRLSAAFTKAGDYGTVQLALDGKPLGKAIDLFVPSPAVVHTGDVPLGTATLDAGPHTLSITLTGKNPRSTNYLVGIDWVSSLRLRRTPPVEDAIACRIRRLPLVGTQ